MSDRCVRPYPLSSQLKKSLAKRSWVESPPEQYSDQKSISHQDERDGKDSPIDQKVRLGCWNKAQGEGVVISPNNTPKG